MAQVNKPLRVFGVLHSKWRAEYLDAAETTATGREPRPGDALPSDSSARLLVSVEGAQATDLEAVAVAGGFPRPGVGGVGYRLVGEAVGKLRGPHRPNYVARLTGVDPFGSPALTDREVYDAATDELTGRTALGPKRLWDPASPSAVGVIGDTDLHALSAGDRYTVAWVPGATRPRLLAVCAEWVGYVDDPGPSTSWTQLGAGPTTPTAGGVSGTNYGDTDALAFDAAGALVWFHHLVPSTDHQRSIEQWASSDLGASWSLVATVATTGTDYDNAFDACRLEGGAVAVVLSNATLGGTFVAVLGSAYESINDAPMVEVGSGIVTRVHDVAIAQEPDGTVYIYISTATAVTAAPYTIRTFRSTDRCETWTEIDRLLYQGQSGTNEGPRRVRLDWCAFGGLCGVLLAGDGAGYFADTDTRFVRLGGYRAPGRETDGFAEVDGTREDYSYVGTQLPTDFGGTNTGGAGTVDTNRRGWTTTGTQAYWTYDLDTSAATGVCAEFSIQSTTAAAADPPTADAGVKLRSRDASNERQVSIYFDAGGYRIRDELGATWLTSKIAVDLTGPCAFILDLNGTDGYVAHALEGDTEWAVTTFTTTETGPPPNTVSRLSWGQFTTTSGLIVWQTVRAKAVHVARKIGLANHPIRGRAPLPEAYDDDRGRVAWLRLQGGPALAAQEWALPAAYGYPVEAVFPDREPSPDAPWRSADDVTAQRVAVDSGADVDLGDGRGSVVFAVRGANVRYVELWGRPDGGAWAQEATLDLAEGFDGIRADRVGRTLTPSATSDTGARYVRKNELAGCWAALDPNGTPLERRIESNTAGWWGAVDGPRVAVTLADVDGTEPTTDFEVWLVWTSGCVVKHGVAAARHWGVRVDGGARNPDGYKQLGTVYVCGAVPLGKQWSANAEWTHQGNVRSEEDAYGVLRRTERGPVRRALSLVWDDGQIEERHVSGDAATAPYLATDAGQAKIAQDDVRGQILGMLEAARGGADPVVVVLGSSTEAELSTTITDPTAWFVGYLDGQVRVASQGYTDPAAGEFTRIGPVLLVESA